MMAAQRGAIARSTAPGSSGTSRSRISSSCATTAPAPLDKRSFNLDFGGKRARLGVIYDLTEQLNAERRASEVEERYQALLKDRQSHG